MSIIIDGLRDASPYIIFSFFWCAILSALTFSFIYKKLFNPRFSKRLVFFVLISSYIVGSFLTSGYLAKTFKFEPLSFLPIYIFLTLIPYAYPLLFREKYIDIMFLVAVVKLITLIYLIAYFPFQLFKSKYNLSIYTESIFANTLNNIGMLIAILLVAKFLKPHINKTPMILKISLFSIHIGMDTINTILKFPLTEEQYNSVIMVAMIFLAVTLIAIFASVKTIKDKEEEARLLTTIYYESDKYKYYKQVEKKNLEIRQLSHDMHSHLAAIKYLAGENNDSALLEYVNKLSDKAKSVSNSFCANKIADTVLTSEIENALDNGVNLNISAEIPEAFFVDSLDLVSLMSNVIDNAIEAAKNADNKEVSFNAYCDKNSFNIVCKNVFDGKIKKVGKKILSTKADMNNHGLGIDIIKRIVEKYNGKYHAEYSDSEYRLVIYIPYVEDASAQ